MLRLSHPSQHSACGIGVHLGPVDETSSVMRGKGSADTNLPRMRDDPCLYDISVERSFGADYLRDKWFGRKGTAVSESVEVPRVRYPTIRV